METESGAVSTAGRASGPGMARGRSHADSGPQGLKTEIEGPDAHYFVGKKRGQDAPSTTAKSGPACRPRPVVSWGREGGTAGPGPGVGRRGDLRKGREASGVGGGPGPVQQAALGRSNSFPAQTGLRGVFDARCGGTPRPPTARGCQGGGRRVSVETGRPERPGGRGGAPWPTTDPDTPTPCVRWSPSGSRGGRGGGGGGGETGKA